MQAEPYASVDTGKGTLLLTRSSTDNFSSPSFAAWSDRSAEEESLPDFESVHSDLIYFLAKCQAFDIDFLPITWQPAMASLGQGGQARIHQSLLSATMSFAYRQIDPLRFQKSKEDCAKAYEALIRELSILRHPALQDHPWILKLEGVCWNILGSQCITPVLVFEKSNHGNLMRFLASPAGQEAGFEVLVDMWINVAVAVLYMHASDIVHLDIKPDNVLAFSDESGYHAKLADFGFAVELTSRDMRVKAPNSPPWTDPQRDLRGSYLPDAKKLDIYSLGMLFLWMLFKEDWYEESFWTSGFSMISINGTTEIQQGPDPALKSAPSAPAFARRLITQSKAFDTQTKDSLLCFFAETLTETSSDRSSDIVQLIQYIKDVQLVPPPHKAGRGDEVQLPHYGFQVAKSFELIKSSPPVRKYIVASLQRLAETSECPECKSNAMCQMAFCSEVGFGMRRDVEESRRWLDKSGWSLNTLAAQIDVTRSNHRLYHNDNLNVLSEQGFLIPIDFVHEYRRANKLEAMAEELALEISDLQASLGRHWGVSFLKNVLASIHVDLGAWELAEGLYRERIRELEDDPASEPVSMVFALNNLATVLVQLDKAAEAERLFQLALLLSEAANGREHPHTLVVLEHQAEIRQHRGDYEGAEKMYKEVLEVRESNQGIDHPDTLHAANLVANILQLRGKYDIAVDMNAKVLARMSSVIEEDEIVSLICMHTAASAIRECGKPSIAEEECRKLLPKCTQKFGADHSISTSVQSTLGLALQDQGKHKEAEVIFRSALAAKEAMYGPFHYSILKPIINLALQLQYLARYEEAEQLHRRAMKINTETREHYTDTLANMHGLSGALIHQAKYEEAEQVARKTLAARKETLGRTHPDTAESAQTLGLVLLLQGRYQEAEAEFVVAVSIQEAGVGRDHPRTLQSLHHLVWAMEEQGKFEQAQEICRSVLSKRQALLGPKHPETFQSQSMMGQLLEDVGKHEEAEEIFNEVCLGVSETLGEMHPDTLADICKLGLVQEKLNKLEEAEKSCRRAAEGFRQIFGLDHTSTLRCMDNLARIMCLQSRFDDAISILRQTTVGFEKRFGPDHQDTLISVFGLASNLARLGDEHLDEASALCEKVWNSVKRSTSDYAGLNARCSELRSLLDNLKSQKSQGTEG